MSKTLYVRRGQSVRDPFREFDGLVKAAFGQQATEATAGFSPAAESYRDGDDAVVRLEVPGVDVTNDVNVEVLDGRLVISGERKDQRKDERTEETGTSRVSGFRYGSFKKAFRLGRQVSADQVSASYDAGVLTVRVSGVYAEVPGQKIEISTGA
jgi:HSP20 family protein